MKYHTKILECYYPDMEANDNCIVQVPVWDGWNFMGYQVVKANWKLPDLFDHAVMVRV